MQMFFYISFPKTFVSSKNSWKVIMGTPILVTIMLLITNLKISLYCESEPKKFKLCFEKFEKLFSQK